MTHAAHCQPAPIEMPPPTKREYLSVSQAAAAAPIPCNGQTVVRWIMHGVLAPSGGRGLRLRVFLHAKKCGGRWAIARADLHAFFEATTAVPAG
ncbi:MAG TPA: hypothetical protein VLL76_10160, partial [Candidatus Omnitrophota bacterium]|nr:hypothetical protein [Candidatus Omnitrophota bacterium]